MRAVLTRCSSAHVVVDGEIVGSLPAPGVMALVGVSRDDTASDAERLVRKIAGLRILDGERSVLDASAPMLVISQFTLFGDVRKGRRPSWSRAAPRDRSEPLIDEVVARLRGLGLHIETGRFGAKMTVSSVNEGPFTVLVDTDDLAEAPAPTA